MATKTQEGPTVLAGMADEMRKILGQFPQGALHRVLGRGLHIVLERRGPAWRLALGRTTIHPHETEAQICGRCFGVPEGTVWVRQEERRRGFLVMECRWMEY